MNRASIIAVVAAFVVSLVSITAGIAMYQKGQDSQRIAAQWVDEVEVKIEDLQMTALEMRNICNHYLYLQDIDGSTGKWHDVPSEYIQSLTE